MKAGNPRKPSSSAIQKHERDQRHDAKRRQQNAARGLYKTKRWLLIRENQLRREPLCAYCLKANTLTTATVCDHVDMHGGDPALFWLGPWQSLCEHHHNSTKQQQEKTGYSDEIGADGTPIDPDHPFNR